MQTAKYVVYEAIANRHEVSQARFLCVLDTEYIETYLIVSVSRSVGRQKLMLQDWPRHTSFEGLECRLCEY